MASSNRRSRRRFQLELASSIRRLNGAGPEVAHHLVTRDISSAGAFFPNTPAFGVGDRLAIEFSLAPRGANGMANVDVVGTVLRCEGDGMAVAFAKDYHLTALVSPAAP